jgi:hypothetical protein
VIGFAELVRADAAERARQSAPAPAAQATVPTHAEPPAELRAPLSGGR